MSILELPMRTKLAVTAGLAAILVGGMMVNERLGSAMLSDSKAAADREQALIGEVGAAEAALLRVQIAARDMRLAASADELDAARERMRAQSRAGAQQLERAIGQTARADQKERLTKVRSLVDGYRSGAEELGMAASPDTRVSRERGRAADDWSAIEALLGETSELAARSAAGVDADVVEATAKANRVGLAVGLAVVLLLVGSAVFLQLDVARPIRRIGVVLRELADGNRQVRIPYTERSDEIGDTARAAETCRGRLLRMEEMEAEQKRAEARAASQRSLDTQTLADNFEAAVGSIIAVVSTSASDLQAAATSLTGTADTTQQLAASVAAASESASTSVRTVAAASDELAASVGEISRQVIESNRIAHEAVRQAQQADARINELSKAASRIGDVVKLITAIAEQTNLLALNATIEAARAGEAGRGFGVVAAEVKALAAQTARATDEIGHQVTGMQVATRESVASIKQIGTIIGQISTISSVIASAIEEQGSTTREIARSVQQAAQGSTQVATNITEVNRGATETGAASGEVLLAAEKLANQGNLLKAELDRLLATMRAA
jgi:methyl-accepting chemotaxis protein